MKKLCNLLFAYGAPTRMRLWTHPSVKNKKKYKEKRTT